MKENIVKYRTSVCNINYHIVWCVKYRSKVLTPEREAFLQKEAEAIGKDKGFIVRQFETGEMDHVHCFVTAPPTMTITAIVKYLKGITARRMFMEYPELHDLLRKGQLWNHSYYVETVGDVSEETIRKYIDKQTKAW